MKTALSVLERPQFPNPGWQLPERIESLQKQKVIDGLAELEADERAMRLEEKMEANKR